MPAQVAQKLSVQALVAPGSFETFNINLIVFSEDGSATVIQQHDLRNAYISFARERITPVFNKVITNLKKQNEHLALQLNFEFGNISEEEFVEQEEKYLSEPEETPIQKLKQDIGVLFAFSDVFMDAEEISEAFNCRLNAAEDALQMFLLEDKQNAGV
jgi:hypothetical protein